MGEMKVSKNAWDQVPDLTPDAAAVQATKEPAGCFDPTSTPPVPARDKAGETALNFDPASTLTIPVKDQAADLSPDAAAVEEPAFAPQALAQALKYNLPGLLNTLPTFRGGKHKWAAIGQQSGCNLTSA